MVVYNWSHIWKIKQLGFHIDLHLYFLENNYKMLTPFLKLNFKKHWQLLSILDNLLISKLFSSNKGPSFKTIKWEAEKGGKLFQIFDNFFDMPIYFLWNTKETNFADYSRSINFNNWMHTCQNIFLFITM